MNAPVAVVVIPLAVALAAYVVPEVRRYLNAAGVAGTLAGVIALGWRVVEAGPFALAIGGWPTPPGIALRVDALSVMMLTLTAVVTTLATLYAAGYWAGYDGPGDDNRARAFWPLWWMLWAGLNALFVAGDAFNVYVCLELIGLSAVALVAVSGELAALRAALRYLLVSLAGSLAYLVGVALLYGRYRVLDIEALSAAVAPEPTAVLALAILTAGLLMKTALFPLHFWLPPAHGEAPGPVSAVLSALVVKAGVFVLLRYWLEIYLGVPTAWGALFLGVLGAGAVIWGSFQALAAARLKLVVAYSTVAQLGYLFMAFPLMSHPAAGRLGREGMLYLALSHGLAKAAAFLAAGTCLWAVGTDRISEIGAVLRRFPVTAAAFALAGVSLIGLPPTGGFVGKWLLLGAMIEAGQWAWVVVIAAGTFLAVGYIFRVLIQVFPAGENVAQTVRRPHPTMELASLLLALAALGMGFLAPVLEPFVTAYGGGAA